MIEVDHERAPWQGSRQSDTTFFLQSALCDASSGASICIGTQANYGDLIAIRLIAIGHVKLGRTRKSPIWRGYNMADLSLLDSIKNAFRWHIYFDLAIAGNSDADTCDRRHRRMSI